jgi:hypothetical protein
MPEYDNTNRGVLFKNEQKTEPKHSDYQGSIDIEGVEYWLNAWIKKSKAGKPFMSLSVKPKQEQQPTRSNSPAPRPAPRRAAPVQEEDDDTIPF